MGQCAQAERLHGRLALTCACDSCAPMLENRSARFACDGQSVEFGATEKGDGAMRCFARILTVSAGFLASAQLADAQVVSSRPAGAPHRSTAFDPGSAIPPATIAAAEAEGATLPRLRVPPNVALPVAGGVLYGTAIERRCVEGFGIGPVQSGEFIIGGELSGIPSVVPRRTRKIWWAPVHPAPSFRLVVRGQLLGSPGDTVRYVSSDWARAIPSGVRFYPSGFVVPKAGRWLLVATSGPDWGCFILNVMS
jgi:hypothetical protein